MRRSASEIIRNLEGRIARLEKQASTNYLINDFKVPSTLDKNQISSELEGQIQDMFDGTVQLQITDIKHNNKMMSAKGTFSLDAPIEVEKSVLELIEDGDVPYQYYDILDEDEITLLHFQGKGAQFFLHLLSDGNETVLEMHLEPRANSDSHPPFYEEVRELLLDRFGSWGNMSRGDHRSLLLETRFNEIEDNVKVAKKAVSLAMEIEKALKPTLKRYGIRL